MGDRKVDIVSTFDTSGVQDGAKAAADAVKNLDKSVKGAKFDMAAVDVANKKLDKTHKKLKELDNAAKKGIKITVDEKNLGDAEAKIKRMLKNLDLDKAMKGKGAHWRDYEKERLNWEKKGKGGEFAQKFAAVHAANTAADKKGGMPSARQVGRIGKEVAGAAGAAFGPLAAIATMGPKLAIPIAAVTYLGSKALPAVKHLWEELTDATIPGFGASLKDVDRALTDLFDYSARGGLQRMHKDTERAEEDFKRLDKYFVHNFGQWRAAQSTMFQKQRELSKAASGEEAYAAMQTGPSAEAQRSAYQAGPRAEYMKREVDKTEAEAMASEAGEREFAKTKGRKRKELEYREIAYGFGNMENVDKELNAYRVQLTREYERKLGRIYQGGPEGQAAFAEMKAALPDNKKLQTMDSPAALHKYLYETQKKEGTVPAEFQAGKQLEQGKAQIAARDKLIAQGKTLVDLELEAGIAAMRWQMTEANVSEEKKKQLEDQMRRDAQQANFKGVSEPQRQTGLDLDKELRIQFQILSNGDILNEQANQKIRIEEEYIRKAQHIKELQMDEDERAKLLTKNEENKRKEIALTERGRETAYERELAQAQLLNKFPGLTGRMGEIKHMEETKKITGEEAGKLRDEERVHQRTEHRARALQNLQSYGQGTYEETRSPQEKLHQEMVKLQVAKGTGAITGDTYNRKLAKMAIESSQQGTDVSAKEAGSVEAYSTYAKQANQDQNLMSDLVRIQEQALAAQMESNRLIAALAGQKQNMVQANQLQPNAQGGFFAGVLAQ